VLHEANLDTFGLEPAAFDLAVCTGAVPPGGYRDLLGRLAAAVRPGGLVLVGEGFWQREPDPAWLAAFGAAREDYTDHAGNVAAAVGAGLVPLYAQVSSDADWDHYEWRYVLSVERYAAEHPDDPDVPAMLARVRAHRDLYLRGGRGTLGYALYLFRRDDLPAPARARAT
jgi:hypothetical protein